MKRPEVAFSEITAFQDQLWDDEVLYNALVVPHPEVWKATRRNDKDYESSLEFCYNAGEWLRREIALKYPELSENDVYCITEKLFDEYGTLHTDKFQLIRWRNMNDYRLCDKFSSQLSKKANQMKEVHTDNAER